MPWGNKDLPHNLLQIFGANSATTTANLVHIYCVICIKICEKCRLNEKIFRENVKMVPNLIWHFNIEKKSLKKMVKISDVATWSQTKVPNCLILLKILQIFCIFKVQQSRKGQNFRLIPWFPLKIFFFLNFCSILNNELTRKLW